MVTLTAPNGATVSVADDKADRLLSQGFTKPEAKAPAKKAPAKKAASPRKSASK